MIRLIFKITTVLVRKFSLTEISVIDCAKNNMVVAKAELKIEPTFMNLGPLHFAVGINSSIWYYKWRNDLGKASQM